LFADVQSRAGLIVTFLALLEMIRLKLVRVFQAGSVGPIRIYRRTRPADAPKPLLDPVTRHATEVAAHAAQSDAHAAGAADLGAAGHLGADPGLPAEDGTADRAEEGSVGASPDNPPPAAVADQEAPAGTGPEEADGEPVSAAVPGPGHENAE
jgi:hypothetical protein